ELPDVNGCKNYELLVACYGPRPVTGYLFVPAGAAPGGCFADEYHWEDGIGDKSKRKRMVNNNWGGVVEDNSFGTHEFLELCELIGCEPYICGNVGSGTVREMAEWIEYINSPSDSSVAQKRRANGRKEPWQVKYWGVGNENWGGGGNMRAEYYADEYKRYATYCRNFTNTPLYKIACGPSSGDYRWTETLMREAGYMMQGLSLHHYTIATGDWGNKGSATDFDEELYYSALTQTKYMDELITKHSAIMDRYDPDRRVGLMVDEWGIWTDVEPGTNPGFLYQQNTMRDALLAAINFDIFMRHCDRVKMANIAQMVNVLQAMILTKDEKMLLTPTYHVFDLYKAHQDARQVFTQVLSGDAGTDKWHTAKISASASEKDARLTLTLSNLSTDAPEEVTIEGTDAHKVAGRVLCGRFNQYNDFEGEQLAPVPFSDYTVKDGALCLTLPPCSVCALEIE
ncbi:MAG: alpha-N-arabinofuranosidase, partial [Clostridia bacterium]|nr:alpha-N-arabinofuranosidase [Clostridia bacterium]